jgi:phosphoheptose isomerase
MLQRSENWTRELERYLVLASYRPFIYGHHDCCLFVCNAIEAMTGTDVAAPLRGLYASHREALRAIAAYAGRPSVEAVAERITAEHQMQEATPALAQRGDIVLLERDRDYSLALIGLDSSILAAAGCGYTRAPLSLARRAWHL